MYHNGQIVHSLEHNRPVKVGDDSGTQWAWDNLQGRTTHYIERNPKHTFSVMPPKHANGFPQLLTINGNLYRYADYRQEQEYSIALPESVEEAEALLKEGRIVPAPVVFE